MENAGMGGPELLATVSAGSTIVASWRQVRTSHGVFIPTCGIALVVIFLPGTHGGAVQPLLADQDSIGGAVREIRQRARLEAPHSTGSIQIAARVVGLRVRNS